MSLYIRLFIFIIVVFFGLSCSQNSKKMIGTTSSLDKPPKVISTKRTISYKEWIHQNNINKPPTEKLILREKNFNFTDGITKAEALYFAQHYCIQTHKDEYLNIFKSRIKEDDGAWTISYKVLPKVLYESISSRRSDTLSKIMPFIMMIDKKTGQASIVVYTLNSRTSKIDVSADKITYRP